MSEANPYEAPKADGAVADPPDPLLRIASPAARLGAAVVDMIVGIGVLVLSVYGCASVSAGHGGGELPPTTEAGLALFGLGFGGFTILQWVLLARHGQTIGKRLVGIRVVRADGSPAGFLLAVVVRSLINSVLCAVPYAGWLYFLVDSAMLLSDPQRRAAHDRLAGTIVVDVRGS